METKFIKTLQKNNQIKIAEVYSRSTNKQAVRIILKSIIFPLLTER
jgi:hypothetical protein